MCMSRHQNTMDLFMSTLVFTSILILKFEIMLEILNLILVKLYFLRHYENQTRDLRNHVVLLVT